MAADHVKSRQGRSNLAMDATAWCLNVSSSVFIVFVNKVCQHWPPIRWQQQQQQWWQLWLIVALHVAFKSANNAGEVLIAGQIHIERGGQAYVLPRLAAAGRGLD